jgi:hypothetical protein
MKRQPSLLQVGTDRQLGHQSRVRVTVCTSAAPDYRVRGVDRAPPPAPLGHVVGARDATMPAARALACSEPS